MTAENPAISSTDPSTRVGPKMAGTYWYIRVKPPEDTRWLPKASKVDDFMYFLWERLDWRHDIQMPAHMATNDALSVVLYCPATASLEAGLAMLLDGLAGQTLRTRSLKSGGGASSNARRRKRLRRALKKVTKVSWVCSREEGERRMYMDCCDVAPATTALVPTEGGAIDATDSHMMEKEETSFFEVSLLGSLPDDIPSETCRVIRLEDRLSTAQQRGLHDWAFRTGGTLITEAAPGVHVRIRQVAK